ncbi:murein hydrolase activator EnvC [Erythrobacter sp. HKB08]|uniref:murein hydrolase activator EnvC family protein n=1 Tax=Erythrobacter sp. HKB08 TaxID=2502843 RepID=UPI0010090728|nr:peptidoglycan DD-metalloendopeptidase family protein [Erythrobacter sp. HKB08]
MTRRYLALFSSAALAALVGGVALAQGDAPVEDADAIRKQLRDAQREARQAEERGERLEAAAREATEAAEKTAREAAALAARIQQAEAGIAAAEARVALINRERSQLASRLAERREPLVRLTGALQKLARRPVALSALKPGSLRETVYLRAMLESTIPQVRERTAALRAEIARGKELEREANQALAVLRDTETQLGDRRKRLAAIETRQRLASRRAGGDASRENERALALAEQARDLDEFIEQLDRAGSLRSQLAALPGPVMRPAEPEQAAPVSNPSIAASPTAAGRLAFQLPVSGRTVSGFGEQSSGGVRSTGLTLRPRDGAQVVAPAKGRVAFAGPYRGYGRIVILEHDGDLTSLVTGLARTDVAVGDDLVAGAPLGVAGVGQPEVMLEVRREGQPINPLAFIR